MFTIDRIGRLLAYYNLDWYVPGRSRAHSITENLDLIDSHLNVDTASLPSKECQCLWHIGKMCSARRPVGARVALLEEVMAREEITKDIRDLQERYAYG